MRSLPILTEKVLLGEGARQIFISQAERLPGHPGGALFFTALL